MSAIRFFAIFALAALSAAPVCPQDLGPVHLVALRLGGAALAMRANGEFVVVWQQPVPGDDIHEFVARQFAPGFRPLGQELSMGVAGGWSGGLAEVAPARHGRYLATWVRASRTSSGATFAQLQTVGPGQAVGRRLTLSSAALSRRGAAWASTDAALCGDTLALALTERQPGRTSLWAQRRALGGDWLAPRWRVTSVPLAPFPPPAVVGELSGAFTVVYITEHGAILGRRFDAADQATRSFRVFGGLAWSAIDKLAAAGNPAGDLIVAWQAGSTLWARVYGPGGVPRSGGVRINDEPLCAPPGRLRAATDAAGRSLVVWDDPHCSGEVRGRWIERSGGRLGPEFVVAAPGVPFVASVSPDVASGPAGEFVVVWSGFFQSEHSVLGRRIRWGDKP